MNFAQRLRDAMATSGSLLCLGLDPQRAASAAAAERECLILLDACMESVCAVKPNVAFFERFGSAGWRILEGLRERIPSDRILLIDAKRGDIGSTAAAYASAVFDGLGADAVTVNPLMGRDSVAPFLEWADRGVFLLTRTSNPGAADFLEQPMADGDPLFARIVATAMTWDPGGRIGYVVGATDPAAVAVVRRLAGDAPLLAPGVGAQGGDLAATIRAGLDKSGYGLLVPVSRAITSAPEGPGAAAATLRDAINTVRAAVGEAP